VLLSDKSGQLVLSEKSGTITKQVRSGIFSLTFDHCCQRNLLTVSSIDSILLLLDSLFCWDHFYAIGKCIHHLIALVWPGF
jgi:hypothetical protein